MIKRRLLCEYREKLYSLILLKNGLDKYMVVDGYLI